MKEEIILVGGGGHCKSAIDVIETHGGYDIVGIIDVKEKIGQKVLDYEIKWSDDEIPSLAEKGKNFLITVGQVENPNARIQLFDKVKNAGGILPAIKSPTAHVSRHAQLGEGTIVMHHTVVNADARVGSDCILNTGCLLEHDVMVGDHCHISTHAAVNGTVRIGKGVFAGSKTVLSQSIEVGDGSVISSGSVVRKSIPENSLAFGNPLKIKEQNT